MGPRLGATLHHTACHTLTNNIIYDLCDMWQEVNVTIPVSDDPASPDEVTAKCTVSHTEDKATFHTIFKKGDRRDARNDRGIGVVNTGRITPPGAVFLAGDVVHSALHSLSYHVDAHRLSLTHQNVAGHRDSTDDGGQPCGGASRGASPTQPSSTPHTPFPPPPHPLLSSPALRIHEDKGKVKVSPGASSLPTPCPQPPPLSNPSTPQPPPLQSPTLPQHPPPPHTPFVGGYEGKERGVQTAANSPTQTQTGQPAPPPTATVPPPPPTPDLPRHHDSPQVVPTSPSLPSPLGVTGVGYPFIPPTPSI
ncbi:uncharacterized protein LOC135095476 [Scylla paramamosain]|uniref:uncharacterized protein LOC135095476 n=1 Tax=Scylla paramamosain TaxID=85552 RepID=UPI003083B3CC